MRSCPFSMKRVPPVPMIVLTPPTTKDFSVSVFAELSIGGSPVPSMSYTMRPAAGYSMVSGAPMPRVGG